MSDSVLEKIRAVPSFERAIIRSVTLTKAALAVEICIVTDKAFSEENALAVKNIVRDRVPAYFSCDAQIVKLTPDCDMVAKKILSLIQQLNRNLASFVDIDDIEVNRSDDGFDFTVKTARIPSEDDAFADELARALSANFCGKFTGRCVAEQKKTEELEIVREPENIPFQMPVRTFEIVGFSPMEGVETQKTAVYLADLNFISENVAVCGVIEDVRERTFTKNDKEKVMFNFLINDGTSSMRIGYFSRRKSIDKIRKLNAGDSVVLTCRTELYNGSIRATAIFVDYGRRPEGCVPEKRPSKPVPRYYETVFPKPYVDFNQSNLFSDDALPPCLKDNVFVVFDLETTGLNTSPATGMMDRIIEIGAYRIEGGEINQSFSTFVDPQRRISEEITRLTGITQSMVEGAPPVDKVMPDFFKFIEGAYLVGHNAADFDFKFIEHYCAQCGYMPERKLIDTVSLARSVLPDLSNYKLNTVADRFGITFNHHRAIDDAFATAKIFIELIKIKKFLPTLS